MHEYEFQPGRVVDGDTFHGAIADEKLGLRLTNKKGYRIDRCDAYELKDVPRGPAAKALTEAFIGVAAASGLQPYLKATIVRQSDEYGRTVVELWRLSDGANLSDELMKADLAKPHRYRILEEVTP